MPSNIPPNNLLTDQALYIREVQNRLRELAFRDERIPLIAVDGIYGSQTTQAVRSFQEIVGINPTGQIDKATWDAIYIAHLKATDEERPLTGVVTFPSADYIVRRGDTGDIVYAIQFMLDTVNKAFSNLPDLDITGVYDTKTADSVTSIQKAARLPQTGEVDKSTWDILIGAYMTQRNQNPS